MRLFWKKKMGGKMENYFQSKEIWANIIGSLFRFPVLLDPRPALGFSYVFSLSADVPNRMGFKKMQQIGWLMCDDR